MAGLQEHADLSVEDLETLSAMDLNAFDMYGVCNTKKV